jgi:uncharacterized protein YigA (DUF484 family)
MEINTAYATEESFTDEHVAKYLLSNPDFFTKHPELVEKLAIPHVHKGSISLVELQSEQLRKKVRTLNQKLSQLISIAKQNEQIYRVYADLNTRIMKCKTIDELEFIKGAHALPEIQRRLFIEKRFKRHKFFFGRLSDHERKLLFAEENVNSAALLLIGDLGELGMLAVGSSDASHFNPDMDTLLISQLQEFLGILLSEILSY